MIERQTTDLHREAIVIDGLNASHFFSEGVLRRLRQGGVTAFNGTVAAWHSLPETMALIGDYYRLFDERPDWIMPVRTVEDIHKAKARGCAGMIFGFQDTHAINGNPRMLAVYHALGVRIIQLTYNDENAVGCGCMAPEDKGLTALGREVVAEMNRLGMLVDLSHCGLKTTMDGIEASKKPVAFTHANPLALAKSPRNKPDEAFKALAAKGGVAGVVRLPAWLTSHGKASVDDYLKAIDYLVNLIGIDHVALGTDFMEELPAEVMMASLKGISPETLEKYYSSTLVEGFESPADFPRVSEGLLSRGYRPGDVKKIMGGNWLRLFEKAWPGC
ncbi:MAG: dipeptidase [Desulfobacterota bacterium]|jgi:membrane dipeptidase|nr:dipeptidase [Thermodesulfobacteriota bacterium]